MTTNRLPRPRDPVQLGKLIGDILTGQVEDQAPPPPVDSNKDPAAVALGRKGGSLNKLRHDGAVKKTGQLWFLAKDEGSNAGAPEPSH